MVLLPGAHLSLPLYCCPQGPAQGRMCWQLMGQKLGLCAQAGTSICPPALLPTIEELPSKRSCGEMFERGAHCKGFITLNGSPAQTQRDKARRSSPPSELSMEGSVHLLNAASWVENGTFPFLWMLLHALLFSAFQLGKWALWMCVRCLCGIRHNAAKIGFFLCLEWLHAETAAGLVDKPWQGP